MLGLAAFARLLRRDKLRSTMIGLIVFAIVQLMFEIGWMDPADGARYSLAFMPIVALLAALGLGVIRRSAGFVAAPWVVTAALAAATLAFVWPLVATRTRLPSPPAAAAAYANASLAPNTVIGYDIALKPHAEYLFSRFRVLPVERAIAEVYDRPGIPLVLLLNGDNSEPDSQVFSWPESDAYRKLTRNLYREVTIDHEQPEERFLPVRGVYAIEHTAEGEPWRWLAPDAAIRLPQNHGVTALLTMRVPADAPYDADTVTISVDGREAATVQVGMQAIVAKVALPADRRLEIQLRSVQSFQPGALLHNQDPRTLAVQLLHVETGGADLH
jgi:hypothetical protein